jgi:hypothetical protein
MGNAVGKDDPIPVDVKLQTWHKMYPQYAKNISGTQQGGSLMQKIKHELINPLPGKPPRYDNVIIMVGEDQASMPIAGALMKAVNKFQGYEHVKVSLEVTPRGTGMSFTRLRNILKDPNATPEQQYALWAQGFDEQKLSKEWILHLMDITKKGMGIAQQPAVQQPAPVVAERLSTALIRPRTNEATFKKSTYGRTAASQQRAKELLNPPKPPEPKKDEKDVEESRKKKSRSKNKLSKYFFPGYGYYGYGGSDDSGEGGGDGGGENVAEWVDEGLGSKLAGLGLAGAMALGSAGANARVTPGQDDPNINRLTGKPNATQVAPSNVKPVAPTGFSKEWLQKAADPNRTGRYIISVEKAQELLSKMNAVDEAKKKGADGKACWDGHRYNGTENGKDKCVKVSEDIENIMSALINKIIVNEAVSNNRK